jgi:hypothetical protein
MYLLLGDLRDMLLQCLLEDRVHPQPALDHDLIAEQVHIKAPSPRHKAI